MLLLRQIGILVWKNILIGLVKHPFTTILRAAVLPIVLAWFLSFAKNLFVPASTYGIGAPRPVRSIENALSLTTGGRDTLAIVRNGFTGGNIDRLIANISSAFTSQGVSVRVMDDPNGLLRLCRSSLIGATNCVGGLQFYGSPNEGDGLWNYTLYADGSLGGKIFVNQDNNDAEIYVIPLQSFVDRSIAGLNTSSVVNAANIPQVQQYPYTAITQTQRNTKIRVAYMGSLINVLGVAFFLAICGVSYQACGAQAVEREIKMAALLEVMMPNKRRWEPQAARLASYWIAYGLIYLPAWLVVAIILKVNVFQQTSYGTVIALHLLTGISLSSSALFIGAFFKRAQLSGITAIILNLILAIIAQFTNKQGTGTTAALSLFFPSCNYTYFITYMARWEQQNLATNSLQSAPNSLSTVTGVAFYVLLVLQILVYPVAAALVERALWGTASSGRKLERNEDSGVEESTAKTIEIRGFSKHYSPNWFQRKLLPLIGIKAKDTFVAVNELNASVLPGQIVVLLGANGSGKSSTLDAIAGLSEVTHGTIAVDFSHGLGLCPQTNVLWSDLTVFEHVSIFNKLKSLEKSDQATKAETNKLISDCDLERKTKAKAGSLSGGQMRKLQLCVMFTGGSRICLIDEVSSGIDALARRKIQDILLAERTRNNRSMIFTTHFLDEAEMVADNILIMSKGRLRVQGTAPEIKQSGVYRIHLQRTPDGPPVPDFEGVPRHDAADETIFEVASSAQAVGILDRLENETSWTDYRISGPTLEDAFLQVAEEMETERVGASLEGSQDPSLSEKQPPIEQVESPVQRKQLNLQNGTAIASGRQAYVLFRKRCTVFWRQPIPNLLACIIPFLAAGLVSTLLNGYTGAGCTPTEQVSQEYLLGLPYYAATNLNVLAGPQPQIQALQIQNLESSLGVGATNATSSSGVSSALFLSNLHFINNLTSFESTIISNFSTVAPGGVLLNTNTSSPATFAYIGSGTLASAVVVQNLLDTLITNVSISTTFSTFAIPWQANQGNTLQFAIYFGPVLSLAPAFFVMYPTVERIRGVRGLHYSNGVYALALWQAYLAFDLLFVILGTIIAVVIFAAVSSAFFNLGLLFVVMLLYGITATLFAYVVSLFAKSQLAAFAVTAGYNAVSFLLYLIGYLVTQTYAPVNQIDQYESYVYFTIAIPLPTASLLRAIFIGLNILSIDCVKQEDNLVSAGNILAYGGPILYLILQSIALFAFLVWWDSGLRLDSLWRRKSFREMDSEEKELLEPDIAGELARVQSNGAKTTDGLRVLHLHKRYNHQVLAVDDISFGIHRSEVFALLGPNGAGKSTTISMIRGDLKLSNNGGDVLIENTSLLKHRARALQRIGVCPQGNAIDNMTVDEHLRFYARIRGVSDVEGNVKEVVRAVGLGRFQSRMAAKLSGGNMRKLALGIALMGNPLVILLDEPSSGMDIAAKRTMWKTLASIVPGRSLLLTTHSMEEADALASRAGIMAGKFLALGTCADLRRRHGDRYHVHLVLKSAPYTTAKEAERTREWVLSEFKGSEVEERIAQGQVRFSVPAHHNSSPSAAYRNSTASPLPEAGGKFKDMSLVSESEIKFDHGVHASPLSRRSPDLTPNASSSGTGIAAVFGTLERSMEEQGFEYYTVSQATLDQVFLNVVGKHNVQEEGYHAAEKAKKDGKKSWAFWKRSGHGVSLT